MVVMMVVGVVAMVLVVVVMVRVLVIALVVDGGCVGFFLKSWCWW
jgi:hypothetical protein